jgi:hypothetical protein
MRHNDKEKTSSLHLKCTACGNAERFIEVMEYESHFVNSKMIYVGLAVAQVDRYECCQCGTIVEPTQELPRA